MSAWWQRGPIYQLLVPSFQDTDGDGIGDLRGVLSHVDYFQWLGVAAIWLSPIFVSPMKELGYDVSDYTAVNPVFGTIDDFDELVAAAHARDIKVILDWVPSHTSSEHPWFKASRSGRDHPQRGWYLWRDAGPNGGPPNNWISVFGGSAWEWDEATNQFYLHSFLPEQPDLNWREPAVHAAMHDAMRFWLSRGVDGFRIDAASWIIKDDQFRDNPPNPSYDPARHAPDEALLPVYSRDQAFSHQVMRDIRRVADESPDRALLGELYGSPEGVATYFGDDRHPELHLPLHMGFAWLPWSAHAIGSAISAFLAHVPAHACPAWVLSGHDVSRLAWRTHGEQTRIAAMLLATLRGTPIHYYGEEVGMRGVPIPAHEAQDPQAIRIGRNRDPERTPMQWNRDANAGFTVGSPWLPIGADADTANVADQSGNPGSLLSLNRRLNAMRHEELALRDGDFEIVSHVDPFLAYWRRTADRQVLVLLNFSGDAGEYVLPSGRSGGQILLSTFIDRENVVGDRVELRADEGVILLMS